VHQASIRDTSLRDQATCGANGTPKAIGAIDGAVAQEILAVRVKVMLCKLPQWRPKTRFRASGNRGRGR
jgi:hypothetical protein